MIVRILMVIEYGMLSLLLIRRLIEAASVVKNVRYITVAEAT